MLWTVSCNIGMTCVTTQTVFLNCFLQHWHDFVTQTVRSELVLVTMVWLVLQHKQLGLNCFLQHCYGLCYNTNSCLKCFLQHWYDLCYNTNSCLNCFLQHWYDLCYNTNSWLWNVSCNIGKTCVTTQTVGFEMFLTTLVWLVLQHKQLSALFPTTLAWLVLQHKQLSELFLTTLVWLVLQHKQLALNCFLQHWYDLCYNTNG